jgi:NADH:ubiquinone oxidoreductase subunit 6 (subunit J)
MQPILFWIVGVISILASFVAVSHRKPLGSAKGLVGLMAANSVILFLLGTTLLAVELIVVVLGTAVLVWIVLIKQGKMKLATPGRTRYNITKLVAFFMALWLFFVLWWAVLHSGGSSWLPGIRQYEPVAEVSGKQYQAEFWAWTAMIVLGCSIVTAVLVVVRKREE